MNFSRTLSAEPNAVDDEFDDSLLHSQLVRHFENRSQLISQLQARYFANISLSYIPVCSAVGLSL